MTTGQLCINAVAAKIADIDHTTGGSYELPTGIGVRLYKAYFTGADVFVREGTSSTATVVQTWTESASAADEPFFPGELAIIAVDLSTTTHLLFRCEDDVSLGQVKIAPYITRGV